MIEPGTLCRREGFDRFPVIRCPAINQMIGVVQVHCPVFFIRQVLMKLGPSGKTENHLQWSHLQHRPYHHRNPEWELLCESGQRRIGDQRSFSKQIVLPEDWKLACWSMFLSQPQSKLVLHQLFVLPGCIWLQPLQDHVYWFDFHRHSIRTVRHDK